MRSFGTKASLSLVALAALSLGFAQAASAADLPVKAAAARAPASIYAPSWDGLYFGGHVGGGWGTSDTALNSLTNTAGGNLLAGVVTPQNVASNTGNSILGGIQVGYNWQMGIWVYGVEGDFTWTDISSKTPCGGVLVTLNCNGNVNWTAALTGRLGVTIDRALVYIKGGAAWLDIDATITGAAPVNIALSDTRLGYLLGFGTEYAVNRNWSVKAEYNFIDVGDESYSFSTPAGAGTTTTGNATITGQLHILKIGANYHW